MSDPVLFGVSNVIEITGRGPAIIRSVAAATEAFHQGSVFRLGDTVRCGTLVATVVGIERYAVPRDQPQCSLLLRGVSYEEVRPGQVWERVEP